MEAFLDGIESELRPSPPTKAKATLQAFRKRVERDSVGHRRKRFEQELEAVLESDRFLRSAARRFLYKQMQSALKAAAKAQDEAERVLKQFDKSKKPAIN
jgi:hypothetical protein